MKKLLTFIALVFFSQSKAQTSIKLEDVSKHVDDSVMVCGKLQVAGIWINQVESSHF